MDIIGTVAEKAGISETQAKMAVNTVFNLVDDKLPAPIAAQIKEALGLDAGGMLDSVVGDVANGEAGGLLDAAKGALGGAAEGGADDVLGALGGMLGK